MMRTINDFRLGIFNISRSRGLVISILLTAGLSAFAQSDSALNRSVTVERDFQPVIQAAGKVSTRPAIVETTIEPAKVEYSEYDYRLPLTGYRSPNLLSQPTRFEAGRPYNGYITGGVGHPNTRFDFGYHLDDGKRSVLDLYAHHHAEWGLAALSKTKVWMNFTHPFSTCDLYFGINGGNIFYHKYGHFYDYSASHDLWEKNSVTYFDTPLTDKDKTSLWTAEAFVGIKANPKQEMQYTVQTGYALFSKPGAVSEHQVRTKLAIDWSAEEHHVGANVYVQNNFLQLSGNLLETIPDSLYSHRHNIRVEPYYAYEGKRIRVHAGVNIDMNIGRGHQHLTNLENFSFAPSPHIRLEAQVAKQWLTVYADVSGHYGLGSLQSYMEENRYSLIHAGIVHPCSAYTPVDAEVGFHIRPYRDLLLEIHGGYAYKMDEDYWIATADTMTLLEPLSIKRPLGDFIHRHADYQCGKVGGQANYHYRDIVRVQLDGDYYFWSATEAGMKVYDRPDWEVALRIDGRIDEHWSLYSDNRFEGKRLVLATDGEHTLEPVIDLNLGLQYDMFLGNAAKNREHYSGMFLRPAPKPNLSLFFQLNNWLHRKNEIYYGYRSQGINFLLGATYRF